MSPESMPDRLQSLGRFGLRALRIAASTLSIVELLRSHWTGGIGAGLAWPGWCSCRWSGGCRLGPRKPTRDPEGHGQFGRTPIPRAHRGISTR